MGFLGELFGEFLDDITGGMVTDIKSSVTSSIFPTKEDGNAETFGKLYEKWAQILSERNFKIKKYKEKKIELPKWAGDYPQVMDWSPIYGHYFYFEDKSSILYGKYQRTYGDNFDYRLTRYFLEYDTKDRGSLTWYFAPAYIPDVFGKMGGVLILHFEQNDIVVESALYVGMETRPLSDFLSDSNIGLKPLLSRWAKLKYTVDLYDVMNNFIHNLENTHAQNEAEKQRLWDEEHAEEIRLQKEAEEREKKLAIEAEKKRQEEELAQQEAEKRRKLDALNNL